MIGKESEAIMKRAKTKLNTGSIKRSSSLPVSIFFLFKDWFELLKHFTRDCEIHPIINSIQGTSPRDAGL